MTVSSFESNGSSFEVYLSKFGPLKPSIDTTQSNSNFEAHLRRQNPEPIILPEPERKGASNALWTQGGWSGGELPREPPLGPKWAEKEMPMRNQIIRIRTSRDEATAMKDLATARGLSLSELVRRAALGIRMPVRSLDATHVSLLARTLGELGRVGGNINQLTRRANAGKLLGHDAELASALTELDTLRGRLREVI